MEFLIAYIPPIKIIVPQVNISMVAAAVFNYGLCRYDDFIESQECDKDTQF